MKKYIILFLICLSAQQIFGADATTHKQQIIFINDTLSACRILSASQLLPARMERLKPDHSAIFRTQECTSFCLELSTFEESTENSMGTYAVLTFKKTARLDPVSIKKLLYLKSGQTYSNLQVEIKRNL